MSFIPEDTFVCTDANCKKPKIIYKASDYKEHRKCEPEPLSFENFK